MKHDMEKAPQTISSEEAMTVFKDVKAILFYDEE